MNNEQQKEQKDCFSRKDREGRLGRGRRFTGGLLRGVNTYAPRGGIQTTNKNTWIDEREVSRTSGCVAEVSRTSGCVAEVSRTSGCVAEVSRTSGCVEEVSRTSGATEPSHYLLKIESFSLLSRAGIEEYESDVFQACGYKWRLLLYPNGNEEEDGEDHISLYLVLADTTSFSTGWNVHVYFKFFVYDHVQMNYLIFRVADGKKTQFHAMKTKTGFSKLLSLDCFKDSSNGYLYNDSCVFGAEVFAAPKSAEMETCLSLIEPPSLNNTYSWIIGKFSTIEVNVLHSEEFKVGKLKWKLILYPNGNRGVKGEQLSIYLAVSDCSSLPPGWRIFAKFKLRLKDYIGHTHFEKEASFWFCDSFKAHGFTSLKLLSELEESLQVNGDVITIEAEISVVGTIRNFT